MPSQHGIFYDFLNAHKRKEMGFTEDDTITGAVAILATPKGHKYLIGAVPETVKKYPEVKLGFATDELSNEKLKK